MEISKHAWKRLKQRLGLPKRVLEKRVEEAWEYGISFEQTSGRIKRYIYRTYCSQKSGMDVNNLKIHKGFIYLFNYRGVLVTVFSIPANVERAVMR